jgi:GNAT superfamily N-acetyltransferase
MSQPPGHPGIVEIDADDPVALAAVGQLLHDFNVEYDDPTPEPAALAARVGELVASGETVVLIGLLDDPTDGPHGVAVLRFRPALWSSGLECYLAELYVVPPRRGQGLGRRLMLAAIDLARARGADTMDLGTGDDDHAARTLYESLGFTHRDGGPAGPVNYFYELGLTPG